MEQKPRAKPRTWQPEKTPWHKLLFSKWVIAAVAICACLVAVFFFYALPLRQTVELTEQGISLYQNQQYTQAIDKYNRALELNAGYIPAYLNRGIARSKIGQFEGSIADLNYALQLAPENRQAYGVIGDVHIFLGNYPQALDSFNQAIEYQPDRAAYYVKRGMARFKLDQLPEAAADYSRALELNPRERIAYAHRGTLHHHQGNIDAAIADYTRGIELSNPAISGAAAFYTGDLSSGLLSGNSGWGSGDPGQQTGNEAVILGSIYYYRGYLLHTEKNQLKEAISDYDQAIGILPGQADIYYARGSAWQQLGQYATGKKDLEEAYRLKPELKPDSN